MKIITILLGSIMLNMGNCSNMEPKITVDEVLELKGVASASGIEKTDKGLYVIGDNTPYLFRLNEQMQVQEKHLLFPNFNTADSLYKKAVKPDLEAICKPEEAGETLWLFGSGSGYTERDILVVFQPGENPATTGYLLKDFYTGLKASANLSEKELNIEGAVVVNNKLYLFNRGENLIFRINLSEFREYLTNPDDIPSTDIFRYTLPEIKGITAGFSGVTFVTAEGFFLITASVENTSNWIDDGEVLGSFLGVLPFEDLEKEVEPGWTLLTRAGQPLRKKVESVTAIPASAKDKINLLLVTDSDGGISEIIKVSLHKDLSTSGK